MKTETELKPCPFCGSAAKIIEHPILQHRYIAVCNNSKCKVIPYTLPYKTPMGAIAAWNRRAE